MKKLFLAIGSMASVVAPIAAVVSCGTEKAKNTQVGKVEKKEAENTQAQAIDVVGGRTFETSVQTVTVTENSQNNLAQAAEIAPAIMDVYNAPAEEAVKPELKVQENAVLKALDVIELIERLKEWRKEYPKIVNEALSFVEPKFNAMDLTKAGSFEELKALERILEVSYNKVQEFWKQLHPTTDAE